MPVISHRVWRPIVFGLAAVALAGCWSSPAPAVPTPHAPPRAPIPAARPIPDGELGTWDELGAFHPTFEIPLAAGTVFGWRLAIPCGRRPQGGVEVLEELRLPAPGDWGGDPEMVISADRTKVSVRATIDCQDGWIEKQWSVSAGDPVGTWTIRVTAEGYGPRSFLATFVAPTTTP